MSRRFIVIALLGSALLPGAAIPSGSSFLSAPAGVPLPSRAVSLPGVTPRFYVDRGPWAPTARELLDGETVITTNARMRDAWRLLFEEPYDPSRFDFSQDFVVLMGGGRLQGGSFGISSVEQVDADWASFFLGGMTSDRFVAVTSTKVLPGILPYPPPPFVWQVSAVTISRQYLNDVVFHREVIAAP